jgi:uncharacterized RDD family membrane protein YckC
MDYLITAAVVWPFPIVLASLLILKNETLDPIMQAALYTLIGIVFVVAAFVMASRLFSKPPDLSHPD